MCLASTLYASPSQLRLKEEPWSGTCYSYGKGTRTRELMVTGKFGLGMLNEVGQRLIEFCQENALIIANTLFQQHKRRLYKWTSSDGQNWNQIDYIFYSQNGDTLNSQQKQEGKMTVAEIMNSWLSNSDLNSSKENH